MSSGTLNGIGPAAGAVAGAQRVATTRVAARMVEQEARGLLTRLARIRPFALQETMLPAASLSPSALVAIERFLIGNRVAMRHQVHEFIQWLHGPGRSAPPDELQRRFTIVRLRFNDVLSQFDLFSEAITQRSEHETGVWLSGLDVFCADALKVPGGYVEEPQVICYLARGPGAAIRRAKTKLPGGGSNPVGIVRVPRERMVGHGIGSSVVHEVGHQAAALLDLVPSYRKALEPLVQQGSQAEREAWTLYARWISEIVADLWSVSKLGISSTVGLMGVVSLPPWFVFRLNVDDPHPTPWIRVKLSCAIGNAIYPHPQWQRLAALWHALYPPGKLGGKHRSTLAELERLAPAMAQLLVSHRPPSLEGRSLLEVMPVRERRPERLAALWEQWGGATARLREAPPTLALAVIGQARALGKVSPERESKLVGNLLTHWALRSTLDLAEICAAAHQSTRPRRATQLVPTI